VGRLVDRLEAAGLVKRCTDPEDRRIWRLRLTLAAVPILRKVKRCRTDLHNAATKDIDPAALQAMLVGLRKMKKSLNMKRLRLDEDATSSTRTVALRRRPARSVDQHSLRLYRPDARG
jgi:hypothetical protein